jgi:hypothetical protein
MKYLYKFTFLVVIILCKVCQTEAQPLSAYEKEGDLAYDAADYYNAAYFYEIVLKSKQNSTLNYKYAESCRKTFSYEKAEKAYKKVLDSKEKDKFPYTEFYYATTLKHLAKYDDAAKYFNSFSKNSKIKAYYKEKSIQEYKSCLEAKKIIKKSTNLNIERLGNNINSEYSDFAAHEFKDGTFYFSSLRFDKKPGFGEDLDLKKMIAKISKSNTIKDNSKLVSSLNSTIQHSGNSCFSTDYNRIYFTRCSGSNKDSVICKIYMSYLDANENWTNPIQLPSPLNIDGFTFTHPNVTLLDGKEVLFFASNKPDGYGGLDIWYANFLNDSIIDIPINLGNMINSLDDEATPFFYSNLNRLYFSSQWHPGLGGYDIFYADKLGRNKWKEPVNLGVPINSASNDLYWYLSENDTVGYFSSNRAGSLKITEESCCNDIYKFKLSDKIEKENIVLKENVKSDTLIFEKFDSNETIAKVDTIINKLIVDSDSLSLDQQLVDLNNLLPLKLYFHNDEPDSNVTIRFTSKAFQEPYEYYISLKDKYIEEYSSQFTGQKKSDASSKVESFFKEEVIGEFNRMNVFLDELNRLLNKGLSLEVFIKGFTSPRASNDYNLALAARRIMSVRKQILNYLNGSFWPFLKNDRLKITELPLGEITSPKYISDAYNDPRNSIYSVDASKERRVEIVIVQKK